MYRSSGNELAVEPTALQPARTRDLPLGDRRLEQLRAAVAVVDAELASGSLRMPLTAESLVNLLAVRLAPHLSNPHRPTRRSDRTFIRARLRAVVEYIEQHLDANPSLAQMAAIARLSPTYFALQFKRATGLPPHQYVIDRRVDRAKRLLRTAPDLSLAEVALRAGFSDQSQFSHHFRRLVGLTPRQFRAA
jgi:AraC family transcriptional regulator